MISSVEIEDFKKFRKESIRFSQLTVLTGVNGGGKSTIIQCLLLMSRAAASNTDTVPLSTEHGQDLGSASDVVNVSSQDGTISLGTNLNQKTRWTFSSGSLSEQYAPFLTIERRPDTQPAALSEASGRFIYLGAERMGPRTSHPSSTAPPENVVVGEDGRFVAHALAVGERREVDPKRRFPGDVEVSTLRRQTEAWLSTMVGDTQLDASMVSRTSLAVLRIRTPGRYSEWMLPTNTGFGVSYCLPVIVAGLTCPRDGMLVVDSPEAHLHPAAQSAMGLFLATVAASGVQVVIETHSDHILNGIRKSIAIEKTLGAKDVSIVFLGSQSAPMSMEIDSLGRVSDWPNGFFDQMDSDLGALTRARVRRPG